MFQFGDGIMSGEESRGCEMMILKQPSLLFSDPQYSIYWIKPSVTTELGSAGIMTMQGIHKEFQSIPVTAILPAVLALMFRHVKHWRCCFAWSSESHQSKHCPLFLAVRGVTNCLEHKNASSSFWGTLSGSTGESIITHKIMFARYIICAVMTAWSICTPKMRRERKKRKKREYELFQQ